MISPRPVASNKPRITPLNASSGEVAALIEELRRQEDAHRRVLAEQVLLQAEHTLIQVEHTRLQTVLTQHEAALKHAECRNQALIFELAHLRRLRYGAKSEALNAHQRALFEEGLEADIAACEAKIEQEQPEPIRLRRIRAGRQPLPEHLPRIEHRHEPASCQCGTCGQALVKIGEDISEQLDVEPARFFVHRHIRPQYACRHCETVTAAPIPPAIIDGGLAAPGLLAWIAISKYADHLPLYRLVQIAARDGVTLSISTLAQWIGRVGVALQPLADRLAERLRQQRILHADETPVEQLDPGSGKTLKAYLWAYRSTPMSADPPIIVFDYQTGRAGHHARAFLDGWQGQLMVDDYGGYKALFREGRVIELACMAHARRKFHDLHKAQAHPIAFEALQHIARLYAIEQRGRELDIAARAALRRDEAQPLLAEFKAWLDSTRLSVASNSAIAKAIDYSLRRWDALCRYAESGEAPVDNNPVENAIRPIAIGKKNWLFAGSEQAGQRAAAIQTLLGTARLNGIDPAAWLRNTLEKLPTWPNSRIDELLPLRGWTAL